MTLAPERDLGTPAVRSGPGDSGVTPVTVTVDGIPVSVPQGTSVMRAAALAGIDIPRACATDSLAAFGSCRLCLVEIDGARGTPASCTTPCADGLVVRTDTEQVQDLRRGVMELYLSDHPADCPGCLDGRCDIARLAREVGMAAADVDTVRAGLIGLTHGDASRDDSNPYFSFDPAACIVCSRCVRACAEVQGTFALTI